MRDTLGDYLGEKDPIGAIWMDLVQTVFRDSPREAHLERLSPAARVIFLEGCFHGELVNGGFSQFFSNSSGNYVAQTLEALREIGANLCVELLERALGAFGGTIPPVDRQLRCEILFRFEETNPDLLEELDSIYYRDVDALRSTPREDVRALVIAHLRKNAASSVVNEAATR